MNKLLVETAASEFADYPQLAVMMGETLQPHDVGMVELQQCLNFAQTQALLEVGCATLDDFHCNALHAFGVFCQVDVPKGSLSDFSNEPVLLHFEFVGGTLIDY